jgi:hypothetical protein
LTDNFAATIETLYQAIAILSCRSKSYSDLQRSSVPYLRQSLAALHVTTHVSHYLDLPLQDQLVLFRFIPYAVSLSLSIAYREMRHSKIPLYRARARDQVQANCTVLQRLGEVWYEAEKMAEMAMKTIREVERVITFISGVEQRGWSGAVIIAEGNENGIGNANATNTRRSQSVPRVSGAAPESSKPGLIPP